MKPSLIKNSETLFDILNSVRLTDIEKEEYYSKKREEYKLDFVSYEDVKKFEAAKEKFRAIIKIVSRGTAKIRKLSINERNRVEWEDMTYSSAREHFSSYNFNIWEDEKKGKVKTVYYFEMWKKSAWVPTYDKEVFKPHNPFTKSSLKVNEWNLWQGITEPFVLNASNKPVVPYVISNKPLEDRGIRHFIRYIERMLSYNKEDIDYLLNWLAFIVQNPEQNPHTAVLLRGKQGTGKTLLTSSILDNLMPGHVEIQKEYELFSRFTADTKHRKVICLDEVDGKKVVEIIESLKSFVTSKTRRIEGKGADACEMPNYIALTMTSNKSFALPLDMDDRRFSVFNTNDKLKGKDRYWKLLSKWVEGEGKHFISHFLLHRDISRFNAREAHVNQAKSDMQQLHLSPLIGLLVESIKQGEVCYWHNNDEKIKEWKDTTQLIVPRDYFSMKLKKTYLADRTPSKMWEEIETIFRFPKGWRDNWRNANSFPSFIKLPKKSDAIDMLCQHLKTDKHRLFSGYIPDENGNNEEKIVVSTEVEENIFGEN